MSDTALKIIEDYQKQLQQKDKQLSELHKLLDQQQQLTLQANRQNEYLRLELETFQEGEDKKDEVEIKDYDGKKWWHFWK